MPPNVFLGQADAMNRVPTDGLEMGVGGSAVRGNPKYLTALQNNFTIVEALPLLRTKSYF